jgi:hypothetical protein
MRMRNTTTSIVLRHTIVKQECIQRCITSLDFTLRSIVVSWLRYRSEVAIAKFRVFNAHESHSGAVDFLDPRLDFREAMPES